MALERKRKFLPMEEFATSELGATVLGGIVGSVLHMITESIMDSFLESKYPVKYPVYSTGISAGIFTSIGAALLLYGRKGKYAALQYIGGGIILVELTQWFDMVRVSFEIAR